MEEFGVAKGSYQIHDLRRLSVNTYGTEIAGLHENQASDHHGQRPGGEPRNTTRM